MKKFSTLNQNEILLKDCPRGSVFRANGNRFGILIENQYVLAHLELTGRFSLVSYDEFANGQNVSYILKLANTKLDNFQEAYSRALSAYSDNEIFNYDSRTLIEQMHMNMTGFQEILIENEEFNIGPNL